FASDHYRTASFDPTGRRAVVVREYDATVIDVPSGRVMRHVPFPSSTEARFGLAAAVSGSARWVAVDARDNSVRLFDLDAKDSADQDERAAAERSLSEAGDQAEEALRLAVRKPVSAEQGLRAEALLKKLDPANDGNQLRQLRALEILETLASKEAVALLEKL